jgi:hypothetical protein
MIRDVTGLNEARDGSTPDSRALVGIQKWQRQIQIPLQDIY